METNSTTDLPEKRKRLHLHATRRRRTRPWKLRGRIDPTGPVASADDLYARCGERLAYLLLELAAWDRMPAGCAVSDWTFLIVSFSPQPKVGPYVQFLSDPAHTTVLWEVASLDYMPNLEKLLSQAKHRELTRRGFAKGRVGQANYVREVMIDDLEAARRGAREALAILVDIFDYRGLQPLELFYVGNRIARDTLVYERLRPDELELLLCRRGIGARLASGDVRLAHVGDLDIRLIPGRPAEWGRFLEYTATARFAPHPRLTDRFATDWNAGTGLGRLHLEPNGDAVLQLVLPLRHGMSESQIAGMAGDFAAEVQSLCAVPGGVN